jgi:sarcosine oxidase subunit beta
VNGSCRVKKLVPIIISADVRYPVHGATYQPRGGIAKHDWVAWGAKAASDRGGYHQNTEVTGFDIRAIRSRAYIPRRDHRCRQGGPRCAGHSSLLANLAGFSFQSRAISALSVLLEQVLNTVVMSGAVPCYVSQAHKVSWCWGQAPAPQLLSNAVASM